MSNILTITQPMVRGGVLHIGLPLGNSLPAGKVTFRLAMREVAGIEGHIPVDIIVSRMDNRFRHAYDGRVGTGPATHEIPREWLAEFEAAARRPLPLRWRYAFIHTYKPVLDDAPYRSFATTADYRRWCDENLPEWLGYASL